MANTQLDNWEQREAMDTERTSDYEDTTASPEAIRILDESARWRARDVKYLEVRWEQLLPELPVFTTDDFRTETDGQPNPYMRAVVRQPRTKMERAVPVGVVSQTYTLAQHVDVGEKCFEGIRKAGIETDNLNCQVGLTELGEWMNLRIYFPEKYEHKPKDGEKLGLRLECFNSVDGSSRLVLLLGWLRFVCSNGLVIGETKAELKDIHNKHMDLMKIPEIVCQGLSHVKADLNRLNVWDATEVSNTAIESWANETVSTTWGKKAACRTFHICTTGHDVEIVDPFAKGEATQKPVKQLAMVPGAAIPSRTLYDVGQSLSWIATRRNNPDERLEWQSKIPSLVSSLMRAL